MKIGVLYPRSKAHPGLMTDFAEGIRAGIDFHNIKEQTDVVSEIIGFAANEKEVYDKVEKMLALENVDLLIAYIDHRVIVLLEPLVYSHGKLMIVVNPGANYPENWIPQPNIVFLTLNHSFLCWLTGSMAAENKSTRAALSTSFFDAGYLHIASITKSYMNEGGQLQFNYVNNKSYDQGFEIKPLTDFLASDSTTRTLLCVLDTAPARLFYNEMNNNEISKGLDMYVSPMMLEENAWKGNAEGYDFSIQGHVPYHPDINNEANTHYKKHFSKLVNKSISLFTLQGWETSILISEILKDCKDHYDDGAFIVQQLANKTLASPRGPLKFDNETHYFMAPAYKGVVKKHTDILELESATDLESDWVKFVGEPLVGPTSGWTNTYLCY